MKTKMFNKLTGKVFHSVRTRMILVYVLTTVLMSITSVFILVISGNLITQMDDMFSANVQIEEFMGTMQKVDANLATYLSSDDSDSLLDYYRTRDVLHEQAGRMFDAKRGNYDQDDLIYRDISNMVESYIDKTDMAVSNKQLGDADQYITHYSKANEVADYIKTYADRLNLSKVRMNTTQYLGMADDLKTLSFTNIILIVSVILLNIIMITNMTYKMTHPIIKLASSAEEISTGNFDIEDIEVASKDEISIMAGAFNAMKHSIKEYISELHDKADTESQLLEQQIENLKIQSLLVDAQIKALQMQINPHFLFNTLNAGMQLAMLEGAERTSGFLDDISKMFRYNVKGLNRKVKLKEEIDSVRAYSNLIYVRFGDIIKFNYNIDCSVLDIDVPPLIIQPLVENATIHGIGNLEQGGTISISIENDEDCVRISIEDDGIGINESTKQKILDCELFDSEKSGHTTGIGIANVVQRLRLFFGVEDVIEINSSPNHGTEIILKIPLYSNYKISSDEENGQNV